MSLEHAQKWCDALGNDVDALRDMYSEWFTLEHTMMDDHMEDTITDTEMLKAALGTISSGENGKYKFTATEWCGGRSDYGLIHWDVEIEGAKTFRGLPVPEGTTLTGCGSTFHMLDEDGKVRFESTRWEDGRILIQLGVPIIRPHYWRADFDMEAFLASMA